jgi:hypothetical protein
MGVYGLRHTPEALYPWERTPRYPLDRRLGRPQRLEDKSFTSAWDRTSFVQSVVRQDTYLPQIQFVKCVFWDKLDSCPVFNPTLVSFDGCKAAGTCS